MDAAVGRHRAMLVVVGVLAVAVQGGRPGRAWLHLHQGPGAAG
jgi:hypothetical protein